MVIFQTHQKAGDFTAVVEVEQFHTVESRVLSPSHPQVLLIMEYSFIMTVSE